LYFAGRNLLHAVDRLPSLTIDSKLRELLITARDVHEHWREHRYGENVGKQTLRTKAAVAAFYDANAQQSPWSIHLGPEIKLGGIVSLNEFGVELRRLEREAKSLLSL
jgi:hypothetical protein